MSIIIDAFNEEKNRYEEWYKEAFFRAYYSCKKKNVRNCAYAFGEQEILKDVLENIFGNKEKDFILLESQAANAHGLSRDIFLEKIKEYCLKVED